MTHFNELSKNKKILTIVNYSLCTFLALTCLAFTITILCLGDPTNRLVACITTCILYLLPLIIQWIFNTRISPVVVLIYIIFITFAAFCGSCLNLNYLWVGMDKIQHFTWGYISCFVGLFYLSRTKEIDKIKTSTIVIIFLAISIASAGLWEVIEFSCDNILNQTMQGIPVDGVTPVNDSMFDIIIHSCGSLLFLFHFMLEKLTRKNLGITSAINDFKIDY